MEAATIANDPVKLRNWETLSYLWVHFWIIDPNLHDLARALGPTANGIA